MKKETFRYVLLVFFLLQAAFGLLSSADFDNGGFDFKKDKEEIQKIKLQSPLTPFVYEYLILPDTVSDSDRRHDEMEGEFGYILCAWIFNLLFYKLFSFFLFKKDNEKRNNFLI